MNNYKSFAFADGEEQHETQTIDCSCVRTLAPKEHKCWNRLQGLSCCFDKQNFSWRKKFKWRLDLGIFVKNSTLCQPGWFDCCVVMASRCFRLRSIFHRTFNSGENVWTYKYFGIWVFRSFQRYFSNFTAGLQQMNLVVCCETRTRAYKLVKGSWITLPKLKFRFFIYFMFSNFTLARFDFSCQFSLFESRKTVKLYHKVLTSDVVCCWWLSMRTWFRWAKLINDGISLNKFCHLTDTGVRTNHF